MPASFAQQTIARRRYPKVDDFGTEKINYSGEPASADILGCWAEPLESTKDDDGQVLTVTAYRVAMPSGADVHARDVLVIGGLEYIAEEPQQVGSPTGALAQAIVTARRWKRDG